MNWSYTRLRTYSECPWRYRWLYIEKHEGRPVPAFDRGKRLHHLIEVYATHCYDSHQDSDERFAKVLAGEVDDEGLQREFLRFAELQNWRFSDLEARALLIGRDRPGELFETKHEIELPGDRGKLVGRIDMLQRDEAARELIVTDFKSGGWGYPTEPPQPTHQLRLYGLIAHIKWGKDIDVIRVRNQFVATELIWSWELYPDDHKDTLEWLCETVDRINATEAWPTEPGRHCGYCPCLAVCPHPADLEFERLADNELATRCTSLAARAKALLERIQDAARKTNYKTLAGNLRDLSGKLGDLGCDLAADPQNPPTDAIAEALELARAGATATREALTERVVEGGPVAGAGLEWDWRKDPPDFEVTNRAHLEAWCEKAKRDFAKLWKWDQRGLRSLAEVEDAQKFLIEQPASYTFGAHKANEDDSNGAATPTREEA